MAVVFKPNQEAKTGAALDRVAICASAACMAQCLLLPVMIVITPMISVGFLADETFHLLLLAIIVPVSLVAFGLGYRTHRNNTMLVPGLIGLALVVAAAILEATVLDALAVALLTSLGGMFLIAGHWLNLRERRNVCMQPPR